MIQRWRCRRISLSRIERLIRDELPLPVFARPEQAEETASRDPELEDGTDVIAAGRSRGCSIAQYGRACASVSGVNRNSRLNAWSITTRLGSRGVNAATTLVRLLYRRVFRWHTS